MSEPRPDPERLRAVAAARGDAPFDLLLTGGAVLDVVTGERREADVGLVGPLIASVHPRGARADAAEALDVSGQILAPGFIDTHMHVESSMVTPAVYAAAVVPQGVTTIVWDPHEFGNVLGLEGVRLAIGLSRGLPLRVIALAPSCVPSAPGLERAGADFGPEALAEMLSWPDIGGVAEVMDMRGVVAGEPRMSGIVAAGLASGKRVCGHARGLSGPALQAFAAAGVATDHEITSGADLIEKLRAGFTIELRGSHDHLLPECVAALNSLARLPQTLTICTDDVFPDDLEAKGGLTDVLRRLIRYGLDPVETIRAATLNAATRIGRPDLGVIAPGRAADIVCLSDLPSLAVTAVVAGGKLAARDGRLLADRTPATPAAPALPTRTMKLAPLTAADFRLRATGRGDGPARLRTVHGARFTAWGEIAVSVQGGLIDLPDEAAVMAVIHRHGRAAPTPSLAALTDWGRWRGAFATTVAHDSHNLCVFGRDPADMAAAANALIACGGGMAVAKDGVVIALLPLPVAGLVSDRPLAEVAAAFRAIRAAADQVAEWKPPFRVFKALVGASLACNPGPHLTDVGISDGSTGTVIQLADALLEA
jgi:adenine deaminase